MTFMRLGMAMCAVGGVLAAQAPFPPLAPRIELHECSLSSIAATVTWPAVAASDDALDAYEVSYRVAQKSAWTSWSSSLTGRISTVPSLGVQTVVSRGVSGPITGGFFRLTSSYASVADVDTRTGLAVSPLIAFDASAATVQAALQSIHDVLHVQVTRQGPDTTGGYAWHIEFHESHPRPMLGIHTNLLDNGSVTIAQLQPPTSMCTAECVATVSGLAHSTDYVFRVRAHAATGGWGAWSPVTAPWSTCILALPSMPVQVVATSATVTTISITWSPRIHPTVTSLPTLSYSVASRCHDDVFWRTIKTDPSSTFATITTLRPNTMCQVQVFATNAMGNGPPSDVVVVRSLPGTPLPPQNVTLSCVVGMVLQLLYTPTSDDGGARPVTYVAAYKAVDAIDWIRLNEFKWSAPAPYTRYVARVASVNPLGTSDWVVTNIVRSDRPRVTVSAAVTIRPHQFTLLAATLGDAANRNDKYYMGGTSNGGRLGGDGQPGVVYMRLFALDGLLLKQDALYYTGTAQNYTIPDNPKYERAVVDVYAWGGGGGSGSQAAIDLGVGGGGGFARASFSTSRGAVFQVSVGGGGGGGGSGAGGFGGGGRGGRGDFVGGGGGGATMVYKEKPVGTWSLLVVAPGGGGGGASAVCCSAGGAAGGLNGTAGTAPTAAQMGLPLPVASRDEFHSKFEFGDFRDFMGASAYDNNLEVGYAPGADFSALASPGGGGSGVAGGEAGHQSSYASVFNQVSSNGQERVGGVGGDGKKGGGGGGGGYFGGGGGGGGLQGAGGGGGSGYISMSAIEPLSFPLDPPVPEQVTVVPGVSSLTVKWRAPTNTPISFRPQNEGYLIELAVGDSNEDFSPVDGTTDKHFVVMGLEPATTYAIRVKLIMAGNVGGYSPRVISQTLARPINSWRLIRPMLLMQSNVGSGFRHNDDVFSSPSPRRGHSMVVLGEYSYLFGGFGPGYPCQRGTSDVCVTSALETNELWRYHSATQSWLHVQDVVGSVRPPRREKHTASALGKSKMLVFGGRQLAGPSFNDVWQLDVGTPTTLVSDQSTANVLLRDGADTWTTAVASTDPTATCIQSMQVVLNITHSCLNTLEVFLYGPGPSTLPALQQDGKTGSDVARDVMWTMDGGRQFDGSERISSRYPSTRGHRVQLYGAANASMECVSGPQSLVIDATSSLEPLDAFYHLPAAGMWTLQVHDRAKDLLGGTLTSWQITWTMEPCTPVYEWTDVSRTIRGTPPSPRYQHTSIVVGTTSLFVFGGKDTAACQHDLYRLDYYSPTSPNNAWQTLQPLGESIFHRRYGQLFFITPFQALVPTAGLQTTDDQSSHDQTGLDLLQYSLTEPTSAMTSINVANNDTAVPSHRYFTAGAWWPASTNSKVVLFGGQDDTGYLDDLWELTLEESTATTTAPDQVCPWMLRTRAAEWSVSCGATSLPSQPCAASAILLAAWCKDSFQTVHNLH